MNQILVLSLCLSTFWASVSAECGYAACHKTDNKKLNIHLIPHSHDDVGWMTTPDGYYGSVRTIINSVIESLEKNADRKFTQVEQYFFHRWWNEQNGQTHDKVKKLVADGRLVFSNGGWTVNDEGAAHYNNIIDQMTLGLKFLDETFGKCGHPKVSWQIDPFGASKEMPSLYALMGFDGHVYNRGPDHGEFVWHASNDLNTRIFTTILHNHYSAPGGYNFDDDKNAVNDGNKNQKADHIVDIARGWNKDYGGANHVLVTMGDDFQYAHAEKWFSNMDKLIAAVKARHSDVDIFYSTPNCYIYSINQVGKTYGERDVDYLTYWTGYYTNYPSLKYLDRRTNNILQAAKQLDVLSRIQPNKNQGDLDEARSEVAVLTHHDAITGTSPQKTADDYTRRLKNAYAATESAIRKSLFYLKDKQKSDSSVFCNELNITECSISESNDKIALIVYNPIARPVSSYIRVPVSGNDYDVYNAGGQKVAQHSVLPVSEIVKGLAERRGDKSNNELGFKADLPALGFTTYFIEKTKFLKKRSVPEPVQEVHRQKRATTDLKGKSFTLQVDSATGSTYSVNVNGKTHKFLQAFRYYKPVGGHKGFEDSGSYNFCPDGDSHDFGTAKIISRHESGGVHEVTQQYNDYIKQTVRTFENEDYIEFDWVIGPIPKNDGFGKEIIAKYETDLKSDGVYYTDANGRQTIRRKFDPNHKACTNNAIGGNWHPIYSRISIKDEGQGMELSVLTDRTQGGSSLNSGAVELMVHRRLTHKGNGGDFLIDEPGVDGKGLVVRGKHYVFFQSTSKSTELVKPMAESLFMSPIVLFDKFTNIKDYSSQRDVTFSGLGHSLPENIHLLTLENWKSNQVLLRLEHMYEGSDGGLAKAVDVDLNGLFKTFKITNSEEYTLAANEKLSESKRLHWNSKFYSAVNTTRSRRAVGKVTLHPQEIKTFVLTVENNYH